jgi:hypothetical protein
VAGPVAAETTEQCLATLNGYRKTVGLDRASSSSIPALAKAAANHAPYRANVDRGNDDLLQALGLPDLGLFGPDRTAHLETPALTRLGFTEVNPGTGPGRPSWPTAPPDPLKVSVSFAE